MDATVSNFVFGLCGLVAAAAMGMALLWVLAKTWPFILVHRFLPRIIGHDVGDQEVIDTLEEVARRLSLKAYELDWRIWERERGGPGA